VHVVKWFQGCANERVEEHRTRNLVGFQRSRPKCRNRRLVELSGVQHQNDDVVVARYENVAVSTLTDVDIPLVAHERGSGPRRAAGGHGLFVGDGVRIDASRTLVRGS
jgi:hypothetical protein